MSPHLVVLLQPRNHDDDTAPLLPHHVPEVSHGVHHGPLGSDVGPGSPFVALPHKEHQISQQSVSKLSHSIMLYSEVNTRTLEPLEVLVSKM